MKPNFETAYRQYGQDWIRWINRQMVDFVVPMLYSGTTEEIGRQIREMRKYVRKGHLYAGIGEWNQPASATEDQIEQARRLGLKGVMLFSYDSLSKRPEVLARLQRGPFRRASGIPLMGWKQDRYGDKAETR